MPSHFQIICRSNVYHMLSGTKKGQKI